MTEQLVKSRELVEIGDRWLKAVEAHVRTIGNNDGLAWIGTVASVKEAVDVVERAHNENCSHCRAGGKR